MSDVTTNETECNQIDVLIQQKEDEIATLKDLKKQYEDADYTPDEPQTPAQTAKDPDADSATRAAAANAVFGQNPETVNAEQSEPSPSTHAEQFAEEPKEETVEDEETTEDEAKADDSKDDPKTEESKDAKDKSSVRKATTKKS